MKKLLILFLSILFLSACGNKKIAPDIIELNEGWKIEFGDDIRWLQADFDDDNWQSIMPGSVWEKQISEYEKYDGYAWYRISFLLPKSLRDNAYFDKHLQFHLGPIDDNDQCYLNGTLIGQNGQSITRDDTIRTRFEEVPGLWNRDRSYRLAADDPSVHWGHRNVLAIRVHDGGGNGGFSYKTPSVSMTDIKDYFSIDLRYKAFDISENHYIKEIKLSNSHPEVTLSGKLTIRVTSNSDGSEIYKSTESIDIDPMSSLDHIFSFYATQKESYNIEYTYVNDNANHPIIYTQQTPYILTPPAGPEPRINGPSVFGVRQGNPILFNIPVSGARPLYYSGKNLPKGVNIDSLSGFMRGKRWTKGDYPITIMVENAYGEDSLHFTLKVGDKIQLTPPMGWNSWNCWGLSVSDERVRASAEAMVESGLINYGWTYMNIDDGWEAEKRTSWGKLNANEKFPDMKALADTIHEMGLKIGIYSSPGPRTCGGYLGSYGHELQDAWTWAQWGIDYLKYDWCSYGLICPDIDDTLELKKPYILMNEMLQKVNRDIVYSLCQYGMGDVSKWGASVGGNLWRTTNDIRDNWESVVDIGFSQHKHSKYAKPGEYNDPDMMVLGKVGWGPNLHITELTPDEQYSHVSLWCLLSAPLLLGNDLSDMDDFTLGLLTNREVLAINQDELCIQADRVYNKDSIQVWMKELADGSHAAGIFNMNEQTKEVSIALHEVGLRSKNARIRDLWRQVNIAESESEINVKVYPHGVMLLKID